MKVLPTVVEVFKVVLDTDMRRTKSLAYDYPNLYENMMDKEVVVFLNRSGTMCRIVDNAKGIHTYYTVGKARFDMETMVELCSQRLLCIGLTMKRSKGVKEQRVRGISLTNLSKVVK